MNMIRIAMALKPFADAMDEYDRGNTYRPEHPASVIIHSEGGIDLTFQHLINAREALKELMA